MIKKISKFLIAAFFIISGINIYPVYASPISDRVDALEKQVNFPIGYIYISTSSKNPGSTFGGVWQKIANGRCLLSVDETEESGQTGGTKTETLSTEQIPSHNHSATTNNAGNHTHSFAIKSNSDELPGGYSGRAIGSTGGTWYTGRIAFINTGGWQNTTNMSQTHTHTAETNESGNGESHNNLQPYYTAYIWTKVA